MADDNYLPAAQVDDDEVDLAGDKEMVETQYLMP